MGWQPPTPGELLAVGLIAAVLVVLAGLAVCVETAVGRISRSRMEEMPDTRSARRVMSMIEDRARYVNALLFVSSACAVTSTILVGWLAVRWLDGVEHWGVGWTLALAAVLMTGVSYVALGVAPRTLGRQHAERICLASSGVVRALAMVLSPVTKALIALGNALTPGRGYRDGPFATQAELRELVDQAQADDLIEDDERQMIHSVFELSDTLAREIMVPRTEMVSVARGTTLRVAVRLSLRSGISRLPVTGSGPDDIVGVVFLKDMMRRIHDRAEADRELPVDDVMRPAYFVPDSQHVDVLLREMQAHRVHLAIIVDEYGGTAGIVSIEDILEEIVGEITDEHDTQVLEVVTLEDGFRVSSRMHVDDVAELAGLDVAAEHEGVDTVLGLLAKRIDSVPFPGATAQIDGWRLIAEPGSGRRKRIETVRLVRVDDSAAMDSGAERSGPSTQPQPSVGAVSGERDEP